MRQMYLVLISVFVLSAMDHTLAMSANSTLRIYPSGLIVPRVEDTVTVTCRVVQPALEHEFTPVYKLEWNVPSTASNHPLSAHMNVTRYRNVLTLNIVGIQKRDSGVYLCTATRPEHTLVSNVTIAVVPKKGSCSRGFFVCGTKEYCIADRFVCDGRSDCPDGSDETTTKCGADPCGDKIACDDGRCLDRNLCCDSAYDELCQIDRLPLCCLQYLKNKLMEQHAAHYDDMGFLQSTVYAIIGCVIAFVFVVLITVVAVCRLHMKQAAMSSLSRLNHSNNSATCAAAAATYWTSDHYRQPSPSNILDVQHQQLPPINLLIACQSNNGMHQLVGHIVEPPPYSETAEDPPSCDAPPPPYSVAAAAAAAAASDGCALLRPDVLIREQVC